MSLPHAFATSNLRRHAWQAAAVLLGLALAALLARTFVCDVYRVDSGSMEPYLHGDKSAGERVLVLYRSRPALSRFDPVVILLPGESDPVVKRVVGLPGENVQLAAGDLLIDGARLDPQSPRPEPVVLFDQRSQGLETVFQLSSAAWRRDGEVWHLDTLGLGPPVEAVAAWPGKLLDGRLEPNGREVSGRNEIGDVLLEIELNLAAGTGSFFVTLSEEADKFTLELAVRAEGGVHARLLRLPGSIEPEVLAEADLPFATGEWRHLRFSNVDNTLRFGLDGNSAVLQVSYARNTLLEGLPDRAYRHFRPRIAFGAANLQLALRGVRVLRDLHYTERGTHGVDAPLRLGPDEYFVLGDNSSESVDSREFGPVPLELVLGLPAAVVWPPAAWRRLEGPEPAP